MTFTKYNGKSAVWKYFELNFVTWRWGQEQWRWGQPAGMGGNGDRSNRDGWDGDKFLSPCSSTVRTV